MNSKKEVCIICSQAITNPVCEKCHTKQLSLWINDQNIPPHAAQRIVGNVKKKFSIEPQNNSFCIICSQEIVSVCTYCFFFKVESVLRDAGLQEESLEEFLQTFNYELYEENYLPDPNPQYL